MIDGENKGFRYIPDMDEISAEMLFEKDDEAVFECPVGKVVDQKIHSHSRGLIPKTVAKPESHRHFSGPGEIFHLHLGAAVFRNRPQGVSSVQKASFSPTP